MKIFAMKISVRDKLSCFVHLKINNIMQYRIFRNIFIIYSYMYILYIIIYTPSLISLYYTLNIFQNKRKMLCTTD